jgi:hypothetical protein
MENALFVARFWSFGRKVATVPTPKARIIISRSKSLSSACMFESTVYCLT